MKKYFLSLLLLFFLVLSSEAGMVERYLDYATNSEVTADNLNGNFNNIVNAINGHLDDSNISNTAGIKGSKLASLSSILASAGVIPSANLPTPTVYASTGANSDITSITGLTTPLARSQGGLASTVANNAASGPVFLDANSKLPAVDGSQLTGLPPGFLGLIYTAGNTLITSSDASKTIPSASMEVCKKIQLGIVQGTIRVSYTHTGGGDATATNRLYRNGQPYGTAHSGDGTFTEDLYFISNDFIEVWGANQVNVQGYITNFRISYGAVSGTTYGISAAVVLA
jgi:hypothetical protein